MKPFKIPPFGIKSPYTCPKNLVFEFMATLQKGKNICMGSKDTQVHVLHHFQAMGLQVNYANSFFQFLLL